MRSKYNWYKTRQGRWPIKQRNLNSKQNLLTLWYYFIDTKHNVTKTKQKWSLLEKKLINIKSQTFKCTNKTSNFSAFGVVAFTYFVSKWLLGIKNTFWCFDYTTGFKSSSLIVVNSKIISSQNACLSIVVVHVYNIQSM